MPDAEQLYHFGRLVALDAWERRRDIFEGALGLAVLLVFLAGLAAIDSVLSSNTPTRSGDFLAAMLVVGFIAVGSQPVLSYGHSRWTEAAEHVDGREIEPEEVATDG